MKMAHKARRGVRRRSRRWRRFRQTAARQAHPRIRRVGQDEKARDLAALTNDELIELWHAREKRVMDEFAPAFAAAQPDLRRGAGRPEGVPRRIFWDEDPEHSPRCSRRPTTPTTPCAANIALYQVAHANEASVDDPGSPLAKWLETYGHRARRNSTWPTPRWRERPEDLLAMAAPAERREKPRRPPPRPHRQVRAKSSSRSAQRACPAAIAQELDEKLALARRYMPFREDGKYYLMMGYDLLRDLALEIGRRLEIGDDVFLLTLEEMFDALNIGFAPTHLLAQRKIHAARRKAHPAPVRDRRGNIDELGSPPKIEPRGGDAGVRHLPGWREPARRGSSARRSEAGDLGERYILVCPSTDPAGPPCSPMPPD